MALGLLTFTPILDVRGRPFVMRYADGTRMAFAKIALPQSGNYDNALFLTPFHSSGNDFASLYGHSFIRQIHFSQFFATSMLNSGKVRGLWSAVLQKMLLFEEGNSGAAARDENQIPNGTAFGATLKTAEARIFY